MKRLSGLLIAALMIAAAQVGAGEQEIAGVWVTEEEKARIEIFEQDGKFAGKIVWLKEPNFPEGDKEAGKPKRDRENPDASKKDDSLIGLVILHGLERKDQSHFENGGIYDPENGKTYRCKMELREDGHLYVRGFLGVSLLGRTTVWTRYEPPAQEQEGTGADTSAAIGAERDA